MDYEFHNKDIEAVVQGLAIFKNTIKEGFLTKEIDREKFIKYATPLARSMGKVCYRFKKEIGDNCIIGLAETALRILGGEDEKTTFFSKLKRTVTRGPNTWDNAIEMFLEGYPQLIEQLVMCDIIDSNQVEEETYDRLG